MWKVDICGIDTSKLIKLTHTQSVELLSRIKEGDKTAKETFIIANVRLVLSIIRRFPQSKILPEDMFQAGMIGLIKSVDNFDLSVGVRFSTYAVPMIIGEIKRVMRSSNSMRVSRSIRDMAYRVLQARSQIESEIGDKATMEQIAERLNVAEKEVVYALDAIADPVSLYDPVYNKNGDELLLMDQIGDDKNTVFRRNIIIRLCVQAVFVRNGDIDRIRFAAYVGKRADNLHVISLPVRNRRAVNKVPNIRSERLAVVRL